MSDYDQYELPNGIRVLHKQVLHTKIAHLGFLLDIGSRDEKPAQQGLAHFWSIWPSKAPKNAKASISSTASKPWAAS